MSEFDVLEFLEIEIPPVQAAQIHGECGSDPTTIGEALSAAFEQLGAFLGQQRLNPSGPPRIIYTSYGQDKVGFTLAMPISDSQAKVIEGGIAVISSLAGGKFMRFTHRGAYSGLRNTYGQITGFLKEACRSAARKYGPLWIPSI